MHLRTERLNNVQHYYVEDFNHLQDSNQLLSWLNDLGRCRMEKPVMTVHLDGKSYAFRSPVEFTQFALGYQLAFGLFHVDS